MDRIIEKKKWTTKKILTIAGISIFCIFILYLLFFRDKRTRLYINKDQITIATVLADKFQEFIPVDGVVYPKTTIFIDAINNLQNTKIKLEQNKYIREREVTDLSYSIDQAEKDFIRKKQLFEEKVISLKDFEDAALRKARTFPSELIIRAGYPPNCYQILINIQRTFVYLPFREHTIKRIK